MSDLRVDCPQCSEWFEIHQKTATERDSLKAALAAAQERAEKAEHMLITYKGAVADQLHFNVQSLLTGTPEERQRRELGRERDEANARAQSAESQLADALVAIKSLEDVIDDTSCCDVAAQRARAEALEEAAKVAAHFPDSRGSYWTASRIASAIRALATPPPEGREE